MESDLNENYRFTYGIITTIRPNEKELISFFKTNINSNNNIDEDEDALM